MTDQEEKVLRYDKRQRGLELKKRIATFGEQLKLYAAEWRKLGDLLPEYDRFVFRADGESISVLNRKQEQNVKPINIPGIRPGQPSYHELANVKLHWFDFNPLVQLLSELEAAKEELAGIREFCLKVGDPLD
jgi:hypothetical protein